MGKINANILKIMKQRLDREGEVSTSREGKVDWERRARTQNARAQRLGAPGKVLPEDLIWAAFLAQNGRCFYCGGKLDLERIHVDHVIPLAKGGRNDGKNIAIVHPECNLKKGARDPLEFVLDFVAKKKRGRF